jgi:hypothetical protein
MNVIIQKLNGMWYLIVGSCQIEVRSWRHKTAGWSLRTPAGSTRAPRSSNATDVKRGIRQHSRRSSALRRIG